MRLVQLLVLALALGVAYWAWGAFEGAAPRITTLEALTFVGAPHEHESTVADEGWGIESVRVFVIAGQQEYKLASTTYDGTWHSGADIKAPRRIQTTINPSELGLPQGEATLVAEATDFSWRKN